ncbi:hypothetical protein L0F63_005098 [Massospora cicadina]|nr:hypothetical protein L0F63_005098 [Massospora cicadina]
MSSANQVVERGDMDDPHTSISVHVPRRSNRPYFETSRRSWVFTKAPPAPEALTSTLSPLYSPSEGVFEGRALSTLSPSLSSDTRRSSASNLKQLKLLDDLNRLRAPSNLRNVTLPASAPETPTVNGTEPNSQRNSITSSRDSVSSDMGYFSTSPGPEPGKVTPAILNQLSRLNMISHEILSRQKDPTLDPNFTSPSILPGSEGADPIPEERAANPHPPPFAEHPYGPLNLGSRFTLPTDAHLEKEADITHMEKSSVQDGFNEHSKRDSGVENENSSEANEYNPTPRNGLAFKPLETQEIFGSNPQFAKTHKPSTLVRPTTGPELSGGPKFSPRPHLQRRLNIALEILHTERTYVAGLELIERVFYRPLTDAARGGSPIIDIRRISDIFANLMGILTVNREFLNQLELRLEGGPTPWSPEFDLVGDIFCQMAPYFRMYSLYVKNFNSALSVISDQMGKSPAFASYLKRGDVIEQCKGLPFESYLILPVQRIPRYKLLIEDLLKHTEPTHRDHDNLVKGLDIVQRVATFVNETIRQHEMFMEMLKIQNALTGFDEVLLVPGRRLIKRGRVHKVCRKSHQLREFFLFTDLLVYASGGPAPEVPLLFHRKVELEQSKVVDVDDNCAPIKNSFQIISPEKSFAVYCDTPEEKARWVAAIRDTIEDLISSKRTLRLSAAGPPRRAAEVALPQVIANYQAPVWIPDDQAVHCHTCREEFTVFRRKHHCRLCGNVVCHACSANTFFIPGSSMADLRSARACDRCYRTKFPGAKRCSLWGEGVAPASATPPARFPFNAPRRLVELRDSFVSRDSYYGDAPTLIGEEKVATTSTIVRFQRLRSISRSPVKSCQLCLSEFTVFKWKNQCLSCRKIICNDCLSKRAKARVKRESMLVTSVASLVATMSPDAFSLPEAPEPTEEEEGSSLCDPCHLGVDPAHVVVNPEGGGWGVHETASLNKIAKLAQTFPGPDPYHPTNPRDELPTPPSQLGRPANV